MKPSNKGYVPASGYLPSVMKDLAMFNDKSFDLEANGVSLPESAKKMGLIPLITPIYEYGERTLYAIEEYTPLLDSSNMNSEHWARIATSIYNAYNDWDAFVVLHGTDTMSFTATALSFMLENLDKTVVITGSQIPLVRPRNDGIANLMGSLTIAGHFDIPEVCLYFDSKLFRGNRSCKMNASALHAFDSPNMDPLAVTGIGTRVNWHLVRPSPGPGKPLKLLPQFCNDISVMRIFPGPFSTIAGNLAPPLKGMVMQTFGAGNAPDSDSNFLSSLKEAADRGVVIVNVTQCTKGSVEAHYATGQALSAAGLVAGVDMTCDAATVKLGWLLGQGLPAAEIRQRMQQDLRGELTPVQEMKFSLNSEGFLHTVFTAMTAVEKQEKEAAVPGGSNRMQLLREALLPTLVCSAAGQGLLDEVKDVINKDTANTIKDYDLRTPLHVAASEGKLDVCDYLLSLPNAEHSPVDRFGTTPLQNCVDSGHTGCIELLASKGAKFAMSDSAMAARLCDLVMKNEAAKLKLHFLAGVDVNVADYDQRTPSHIAAAEGNVELAKVLLHHGANFSAVDRFGSSAWDEAKRNHHEEILQLRS